MAGIADLRAALGALLEPHRDGAGRRVFRGGLAAEAYRTRLVGHFLDPRWPLWMRRLVESTVAWLGGLSRAERDPVLDPTTRALLVEEILPGLLWIGSDAATLTFAHMAPVLGAAQVTAGNLENLLRKDLTQEGAAEEWSRIEERMAQAAEEGQEILRGFAWTRGPEPDLILVSRAFLYAMVRSQPGAATLSEILARASRPTSEASPWLLAAGMACLPRGPSEADLPCELRRGLFAEGWRRFVARGELDRSSEGSVLLSVLLLKWFQVAQECQRSLTAKGDDELGALLDVIGDRIDAFPSEVESGLDWAVQGVVVLQFQIGAPVDWATGERIRRMHREVLERVAENHGGG